MPNVPNNTIVLGGIASGINRNDGTANNAAGIILGVASLPGQIVINDTTGPTNYIDIIPTNELDDSPILERAEQATCTHHYRGSYNNMMSLLAVYGRGALVTDTTGNFYRVLSSSVQYQKGGVGLLTVVSEAITFDVPPDEFSLTPTKLGLDILKHPRYFYNLMPTNQIPNFTGSNDTNAQIAAKQAIIRAIQAYRENPFIPTTANINNMAGSLHDTIVANLASGSFTVTVANPNFQPQFPATTPDQIGKMYSGNPYPPAASASGQPNPTVYYLSFNTSSSDPNNKVALALAAAKELIGKLWRFEDTPLVNGLELTWSEYYFRPPLIDLGGYIQDPRTGNATNPGLPDYFYSTAYPPISTQTIFDVLSYVNPQCFSATGLFGGGSSISWLRDADVLENSRTWFKLSRKWLGAPIGAWDSDLYGATLSGGNRPQVVTDYRNLILS